MKLKKILLTLLAVVLTFSCLTLPALAAESVPELPDIPKTFGDNTGYVVFYDGMKTQAIIYNDYYTSPNFYYASNDNYVHLYFRSKGNTYGGPVIEFYNLSGDSWLLSNTNSSGESQPYYNLTDDFAFYYSTADVGYFDPSAGGMQAEPFFPLTVPQVPLWETVLETTEANKNLLNQNKTMLTLTLCGVGLIALLIGLSLFGKVLSRFQAK